MKTKKLLLSAFLCLFIFSQIQPIWAQNRHQRSPKTVKNDTDAKSFNQSRTIQKSEESFFATMDSKDAQALKSKWPNEILILSSNEDGISAVHLTEKGAHELHRKILVHGPGYVYHSSQESALQALQRKIPSQNKSVTSKEVATFSIDQDAVVQQALDLVDNTNIATTIQNLEDYGTRYHTYSSATDAVTDMKAHWESLAASRSDVSVQLVNHNSTNMPSLVMTITGSAFPEEYVIIGGHIDSTSGSGNSNSPGADDNASGIASITEAIRVLMAIDFQPERTVEFMAYAAEEVGLRGSEEIAIDYKDRNVNVKSVVQLDMTNYAGSSEDVYLMTDTYTDNTLNNFLMQLMDHYNASGTHQLTYGTSICNYGCSDHYSWAQQGYAVSFPFEASFGDHNPNIHTPNDTYENSPLPNATHAAKFTKLALEYIIETAKSADGTDNCYTPSSLSASNITTTSAELSWSMVNGAENYSLRYRLQGEDQWNTLSEIQSANYNLENLSPESDYEFQVQTICASQSSAFSSSQSFSTLSENQLPVYCQSSGSNTYYEWIEMVELNEISNTSGSDNGYGDYSNQVANVSPNTQYQLTVKAGFRSQSYLEYWKAWIDFNRNGTYEASEEVLNTSSSSSANISINFTVPTEASLGRTGMRISMRYNTGQASCDNFNFGEVEDYAIQINENTFAARSNSEKNHSSITIDSKVENLIVYPNPVHDNFFHLNLEKDSKIQSIKLFNNLGHEENLKIIRNEEKIDIGNLKNGIYFIHIQFEERLEILRFVKGTNTIDK
ncbi:M20/M25/M40 family metallo-hydrolase [Xanthovirga aplysinae]|uniref:M20/M25/M40 family metallo-hydrolase n=1 Tax=Xanthovirga aplysinae TaxID=2529853 RepID=UPI0012BD09B9|nr:M20/M25/M40 family metallo-hydrolase [Xanthovirga aplysinae]MTI30735.1 M20/M25/M40 family metallo-hydrolase [Xanthovirga aplysinae]